MAVFRGRGKNAIPVGKIYAISGRTREGCEPRLLDINAYLESLRVELRGSGVAVVTVCPGFIATPLTARNPYRMPFLLTPETAAALTARAIARRRRFHVLPWQMALFARLLRCVPRPLFDRAVAGRARKPRQSAPEPDPQPAESQPADASSGDAG